MGMKRLFSIRFIRWDSAVRRLRMTVSPITGFLRLLTGYHIKDLRITAIYFSPVFESDTHGYNTRDYGLIDTRLGTNDDFRTVVDELHRNGIKVVIDGVFNHVGRGFWLLRMFSKRNGTLSIRTGSTYHSTVIPITMTVYGMKAGRATMIWSNSIFKIQR